MTIRIACLTALLALGAGAGAAHAQCDPVGTVPQGTVVYHGTPVGMFTWQNPGLNPAPPFDHPANPDGPAWFADNWQFSIHAGLRYLVGQSDTNLSLYLYSFRQEIAVLVCPDLATFSAETGIPLDNGDYVAAETFCAKYADQYNGYVIQQDAVRQQPEYILCQPAAVLSYGGSRKWYVTQVEGGWTGGAGEDFAGHNWACLLNNGDLGNFLCQQQAMQQQQTSGAPR